LVFSFGNQCLFQTAYLWQSFLMSDGVGKGIIVFLVIGSMFVWTVMVTKWLELERATKATRRFMIAYRGEAHPLRLLSKRVKFPESPLYQVYVKACVALGTELNPRGFSQDSLFIEGMSGMTGTLTRHELDSISSLAECKAAEQSLVIEQSMGYIATAANTAPLMGLLGTVWGVMGAFTGMAVTGQASLPAMAPGVAAALATTVVGLVVALPSAIGYNLLSNKIRILSVGMENFAHEFVADIRRVYHDEDTQSTASRSAARSSAYDDAFDLEGEEEEEVEYHGS
jgi:biopolymer transport protein TolQ